MIDFIRGFLKVQVYKLVFVMVDQFSKYSVFMLALHECLIEEATELFFSHVVKHFGMHEDIVSKRDP